MHEVGGLSPFIQAIPELYRPKTCATDGLAPARIEMLIGFIPFARAATRQPTS